MTAVLLAVSLLFSAKTAEAAGAGDVGGTAFLSEKGVRIGVEESTIQEHMARELYPDAEIYYYNKVEGYTAVAQGKLDAFLYEKMQMELAVKNGMQGVRVLDETIGEPTKIALAVSDASQIPDLKSKVNQFIAEIKSDGTFDEMYDRWMVKGDYAMPDIGKPQNPEYTLRVATSGDVEPFSFYKDNAITGFDMEMMQRFALWIGADLQVETYNWNALLATTQSGKADIIASNLQYTRERAESINYSDVYLETYTGVMVADDGTAAEESSAQVSWRDYNGKKIGVLSGTPLEDIAAENLPDSECLYFDSYPDLSTALLAGKIDAFLADEPNIKMMHYEQPALGYITDKITNQDVSFAFRKDDEKEAALCEEFNDFLNEIRENGTLQEIDEIWMGTDESKKLVDISDLSGENGTIRVVTTATDMPWSYIKDGKNVGYDIDIVVRFCRDRGYALELSDVDFSGRIPSVQSGKYDFCTGMNVTDERKEQVLFSDPTYKGGVVLAVPAEDLAARDNTAGSEPAFTSFEELSGKTLSMLTGAPFEELISSKVKDVKEFTYYQSMPDMVLGVKSGKTDAGLMNNAVAALAVNKDPEIAIFPESLGETAFGLAFAKGDDRCGLWQEAYEKIPADTKTALWEKWTGADDSVKTVPKQDWPGENGTVKVAACDALEPMSYVGADGQLLGLDIETILLIAKELDMHVEFMPMDFSAVLASIGSGKADIGCGSIVTTDERRETMDFVEYQEAAFVLIVRAKGAVSGGNTFLDSVKDSFYKTFIREDRYKLFVQGILTTLIITFLSILLGTALGFGIFMGCRRDNKILNGLSGFFIWLVQGMPVVVLLMILYYIIFAKAQLSGTVVAIIAFTLVFGSGVFGMLKMGVGAIDKGQTEAALALGYGDIHSFFRIILPQAVPHFLPSYKGEVVSLIKATAIVGYIAVQDLTKMGDIVRGRTYEAFFPLIAVAVIYFILGGLLTFIVGRIETRINPKRRKREEILKGVKTHD